MFYICSMIERETILAYVELQLDLFLLLMLPHKKLKGKPRAVFLEHVLCSIEGIDINSRDCIERIRDNLQFNYSNDVWQYRSRLMRSGWFIKEYPKELNNDRGQYKLIPNFDYSKKNFTMSKKYSFTLKCNQELDEGN